MLNGILVAMLRRFVREGRLDLTLPDGSEHSFGEGEPHIVLRLTEASAVRGILLNPELGLGEAYMDQTLVLDKGDLFDFFRLMIRNNRAGNLPAWQAKAIKARKAMRRFVQKASPAKSRRNVAHHYDISVELYDLFLSHDRLYTCGYYPTDDTGLHAAQVAKVDHIATKLLLEPGNRVLDIGCGWGFMACHIAQTHDVEVTGVTLSEVQLAAARETAEAMGVADRVTFKLTDYRELTGQFDRIYSVGMMEHVGQPQYATYFHKIHEVLAEDGVAVIQFIGRSVPPGALSPWFNKYIFPGGYAPAFSEVAVPLEKSGLVAADLEVWRGHYERTLQDWLALFEANAEKVAELYDERFVRMWRYYLIASEMSFREMGQVLFQLQLSKDPYRVPPTRGYLYDEGAAPMRSAAE